MGCDSRDIQCERAHEFGDVIFTRIEGPAMLEKKQRPAQFVRHHIAFGEIVEEVIAYILTNASGSGAVISGLKVRTSDGWLMARSYSEEDICKICA
ncbi:MAG: hypothetical protein ACP5QR_09440 [Rhizomicrobium sp.]